MKPKYIEPQKVEKTWGHEIWMVNNNKYCGKILHFNQNVKFSMHYHLIKDETWYIQSGEFIFRWIDTKTADIKEENLTVGKCVNIPIGLPHQLESLTGGDIIEISSEHFEEDSHRIIVSK